MPTPERLAEHEAAMLETKAEAKRDRKLYMKLLMDPRTKSVSEANMEKFNAKAKKIAARKEARQMVLCTQLSIELLKEQLDSLPDNPADPKNQQERKVRLDTLAQQEAAHAKAVAELPAAVAAAELTTEG